MSTYREEIQNKRKSAVLNLLEKKPMRWIELSDSLIGKKRWFKIDRDLSSTLKVLKGEGKIARIKLSHKNVVYMLTEDAERRMEAWSGYKQKEKMLPAVLEELRSLKKELTPKQATNWIKGIILMELRNYLDGVEHVVRAEEKWQYYARWLLDQHTSMFGTLLLMCGQTYLELADSAIESVKKELEDSAWACWPKKWEKSS